MFRRPSLFFRVFSFFMGSFFSLLFGFFNPHATSIPAASQSKKMTAVSSAQETHLQDQTWIRQTVNQRYDFWSLHPARLGGGPSTLLLSQRVESTTTNQREGAILRLTVEAYRRKSEASADYTELFWKFEEPALPVGIEEPFFKTMQPGCCGGFDTMRYHSGLTGELVFTSTANPIFFHTSALTESKPGKLEKRWVGFHSSNSESEGRAAEIDSSRGVIGVLSIASDQNLLEQVLVIDQKQREANFYVHDLSVYSESGTQQMVLKLNEGGSLLIPVQIDGFDLKQAKIPEGIELKKLKK